MSTFVQYATNVFGGITQNDDPYASFQTGTAMDEGDAPLQQSRFPLYQNGILTSTNLAWEGNTYQTGHRGRKRFTGVTLNAIGVIIGGCTVQLFNTATGALVDTQVSDSQGNFTLTDPNNVACFIVAYLPGSPDVAGTTVDTLTGT